MVKKLSFTLRNEGVSFSADCNAGFGSCQALASANTYAIFGEVTSGMDTVDRIAAMPNSGEPSNSALQPVAMDSVTVSTP